MGIITTITQDDFTNEKLDQIKKIVNFPIKYQSYNKNLLDKFFNIFSNKKFKKNTDLYIGFFGYEILCSLLKIKIKNQKKLKFYKGVFYKPETLIKIRKDIKVISSKKNQVFRKFFSKTKILSPFKLNINYKKYKKILKTKIIKIRRCNLKISSIA